MLFSKPRYITLGMSKGRGRINYGIIYVERNALELNVNISMNPAASMLTSSGLSTGLTFFHRLRNPESLGPSAMF